MASSSSAAAHVGSPAVPPSGGGRGSSPAAAAAAEDEYAGVFEPFESSPRMRIPDSTDLLGLESVGAEQQSVSQVEDGHFILIGRCSSWFTDPNEWYYGDTK